MNTKQYTASDLDEMIEVLNNDGVIAFRTDTVMGSLALANSKLAKSKLVEAKNRPKDKLFPIMVSSLEMMQRYTVMTIRDIKLAEKHLPGALTLILSLKDNSNIELDSETVAVRIVNDDLLISLVEKLDSPIFLTSANLSNEPTTMLASEVYEIFAGKINGVYMEDAAGYEASTIVDLTSSEMKILRQGKISLNELEEDE